MDGLINTCVDKAEEFLVKDSGRSIFSDNSDEASQMELYIEVSFEYEKDDEAVIYMQTLNEVTARFYHDLDEQLQAIRNPFVEPSPVHTQVKGGIGIFGAGKKSVPFMFSFP